MLKFLGYPLRMEKQGIFKESKGKKNKQKKDRVREKEKLERIK